MAVELEKVVDSGTDDIGITASVATNFRQEIHKAAVQATQEVFSQLMLPEAKATCPVGTVHDPHPGQNRDSLKVSFKDNLESSWVSAWLFSESGYGWLIEHGTSHNRALTRLRKRQRHGETANADRTPARPYIYPAILNHIGRIPERAREILEQS